MSEPHITQLREQLLATLADLRRTDKPMEPDRARAVAQVASVLVDSAKVEVEFLKATGQDRAPFLSPPVELPSPDGSSVERLPAPGNGITAITRHSLKG